jgi:hypothetical protein
MLAIDISLEGEQMRVAALILGLAFALVAILYWLVPADSLPEFFPGFEPGSHRVHVKHGIAAAIAAILMFAIACYAGRSRA